MHVVSQAGRVAGRRLVGSRHRGKAGVVGSEQQQA